MEVTRILRATRIDRAIGDLVGFYKLMLLESVAGGRR